MAKAKKKDTGKAKKKTAEKKPERKKSAEDYLKGIIPAIESLNETDLIEEVLPEEETPEALAVFCEAMEEIFDAEIPANEIPEAAQKYYASLPEEGLEFTIEEDSESENDDSENDDSENDDSENDDSENDSEPAETELEDENEDGISDAEKKKRKIRNKARMKRAEKGIEAKPNSRKGGGSRKRSVGNPFNVEKDSDMVPGAFIQKTIIDLYPEKPTVEEVQKACENAGVKPPTDSTASCWISETYRAMQYVNMKFKLKLSE